MNVPSLFLSASWLSFRLSHSPTVTGCHTCMHGGRDRDGEDFCPMCVSFKDWHPLTETLCPLEERCIISGTWCKVGSRGLAGTDLLLSLDCIGLDGLSGVWAHVFSTCLTSPLFRGCVGYDMVVFEDGNARARKLEQKDTSASSRNASWWAVSWKTQDMEEGWGSVVPFHIK